MFRNKQNYVQNCVSMEWSASIHISNLSFFDIDRINMIKSLKFLNSKVLGYLQSKKILLNLGMKW
jgi:hypothetical protein